ncbi:MAG: protein translocase subunit SecF [Candidatus Aminicenantia bacterium]
MIELFKTPNINFMKYKYYAFTLSGIIILGGIITYFSRGGFNYSVDFTGGILIQVSFKDNINIGKVRSLLSDAGLGESTIQRFGERNEFIIKVPLSTKKRKQLEAGIEEQTEIANKIMNVLMSPTDKKMISSGLLNLNALSFSQLKEIISGAVKPEETDRIAYNIVNYKNIHAGIIQDFRELENLGIENDVINFLRGKTFLGSVSQTRLEAVGPRVGKELRKKATLAVIWSLLAMLVYIAVRFKFQYGLSAVLTLTHDVLITLSFLLFFNREISLEVIAALLTIVGYSINDTIVIFDRVRDNLRIMKKTDFEQILNTSINQTLSRTILTSLTVFFVVIILFLFGGRAINDFAFTLFVGVIEGSYSTIYQSCPYVLLWEKLFGRRHLGKK